MKAITVSGERIECDQLDEGREGLLLYHGERVVGYVPYERLECVTETRSPVASSSIRSIGYDDEDETLEIEFQSGGVYRYDDVSRETYESFLGARSHGTYFHENVRGQYDYHRIR
ncbi:KTSC domain-containing protein [Halorussus aquaticus]|uniref:KTSC domain-containing protein n=2 Tax=Halorussus TaxID=1070314 RepID=A0ABD5PZY9_9EURY|nr:KTSC domain-containing protein [Halorussus aquaticus]NEU58181.1 KTSC domain-containing protein [Halorussus sp. MSC15.2]